MLDLPSGIPHQDVFRHVLMVLKPAAFQACFANWLQVVACRGRGGNRRGATGSGVV